MSDRETLHLQSGKFTWKIGGEAGFGIKSAGVSFATVCHRAGYEVSDYTEYPSLIRGGHNTYQVTVSKKPVRSVDNKVDILVAMNQYTADTHFAEMVDGGAVIYDGNDFELDKQKYKNIQLLNVPLRQLAGMDIMRNTVAMGATMAVIGLLPNLMEQVIQDIFKHKPAVVESNIQAMQKGYQYVREHYKNFRFRIALKAGTPGDRMYIPGNEACALGAIAAGCTFYAGYPMTPSSGILHYMAAKAVSEDFIFKHAEDEIAVLNMALGASFAGARAMCATSGGGFSLMTEALGLAGITETGVVIVDCQRPGPATGLPTWTGQADLRFVMHAAQDEFPRIVLAPGDIEECFYLTMEAFNLADIYQMPVIILSDKTLGEGASSVPAYDEKRIPINRGKILTEKNIPKDFKRYQIVPDGISPRTLPGMKGGIFCGNSDEHDEYGYSHEGSQNRIDQVDKRARKFEIARKELDGANFYGSNDADILLLGWGSTKAAVLDAFDMLPPKDQKRFAFLHLNVLLPFPAQKVESILKRFSRHILVEGNSEGQLGGIIRQETGIGIQEKILKYDGRSFFADEVAEKILTL